MKKLRILSAVLAMIIALSCLSITGVSAATKNITALEFVSIPDDMYSKSLDEIFNGTQIKVSFSDNTSKTVTISDSNSTVFETEDRLAKNGTAGNIAVAVEKDVQLYLTASVYISDRIYLTAFTYNDEYEYIFDEAIYSYPSDFEAPEIFCKDGFVYKQNSDDTLTLISYVSLPISDEEFDITNLEELEKYLYPKLEIPETVYGKTVTSIANYALLGYEHPSEVTIPDTVTSIGTYAFGYCFSTLIGPEPHGIQDNIANTRLALTFSEASDNDMFLIDIYLCDEDVKAQADYLLKTYLSGTDCYYDDEYESIFGTVSKSKIIEMENENIIISLIYDKYEGAVTEDVYDFMNYVPKNEMIPIYIGTYAMDEADGEAIAKELMKKYMGNRTDYTLGKDNLFLLVKATASEILAMKDDENISLIALDMPYYMNYDLFKQLYNADSFDKFDIYIDASYEDDPDKVCKTIARQFFSGCKYELVSTDSEDIMVVHGVTKSQISSVNTDYYITIDIFDSPVVSQYYELVIRGSEGSAAQTYAEENSIKFEPIGQRYQIGDVNLDGAISILDATDIMKANVGLLTFTDEQAELADVDGNGRINVADATAIQKALVGLA